MGWPQLSLSILWNRNNEYDAADITGIAKHETLTASCVIITGINSQEHFPVHWLFY